MIDHSLADLFEKLYDQKEFKQQVEILLFWFRKKVQKNGSQLSMYKMQEMVHSKKGMDWTVKKMSKKHSKLLVEKILTDIIKEAKNKQLQMYSSIVYALLILGQAFVDYRNCKSIIDELLKLLNLGLRRYCCRMRIMTYKDIVQDIMDDFILKLELEPIISTKLRLYFEEKYGEKMDNYSVRFNNYYAIHYRYRLFN